MKYIVAALLMVAVVTSANAGTTKRTKMKPVPGGPVEYVCEVNQDGVKYELPGRC